MTIVFVCDKAMTIIKTNLAIQINCNRHYLQGMQSTYFIDLEYDWLVLQGYMA